MDEELAKLRGDTHISNKEIVRRIYKYIKPELKYFILAFIFLIAQSFCSVVVPIFFQQLIDLFKSEDIIKITIQSILTLALAGLLISILGQIFLYFESMILQKSGQRIIYNLRHELFSHVEAMSINQFNEMPVGSLVTRVCNYTNLMSDFFTNTIVSIVRNLMLVIGVYVVIIYYSPLLALVLFGVLLIILIMTFIFAKYVGKEFHEEHGLLSEMNSYLNENIAGMKITQLFNQEERKISEFVEKSDVYRKQGFRIVKMFAFYRPIISFLFYMALIVTFVVGVNFHLSAGVIVAIYLYIGQLFNPIYNLADQINQFQKAKTSAEILFNLLDVKPQVVDKPNALDIEQIKGKIEFKHVWFAYKNDEWILKDVSFIIDEKTTCAFVGATGAGKTTILSLITRNYEIQKGQILIDDIDISLIKVECLRKLIGQMLQDVFLFSGSIKSNITLRDDSFSDGEIINAAKYVNAYDFINKLPKGIDNEVIERGENYSQGQRQLLSFARTVLHKPQILILDEATANIDTETEQLIQLSLEKMKTIGTMLIVAHRLSTIQRANKIICLQNGQIVEMGTHQELLKRKGFYYKLYLLQFADKK